MRIAFEKEPRVFLNDRRAIEKFLWFPKILENGNGEDEFRWIIRAKIGQRYTYDERSHFSVLLLPLIGLFLWPLFIVCRGIAWIDEAWVDGEWHENFYTTKRIY